MSERRFAHVFNCSVDTYWSKIFFDENYSRALFIGALKFESWEVRRFEESDSEIRRVVDAVPKAPDLPGPLKKLIQNGAGYREDGIFDKATRRHTVNVTPTSLPDRLIISGVTVAEPVSDNQCRRVYLARVEANIFGVGGMLEKRILDDLSKSYDVAATFTNGWIKDHQL
jgi:hypothetical protein